MMGQVEASHLEVTSIVAQTSIVKVHQTIMLKREVLTVGWVILPQDSIVRLFVTLKA